MTTLSRWWPWRRVLRGAPMRPVKGGRVWDGARRRRVRSFELDERPVTNGDWQAFIAATGARTPEWMYRPGFGELEHPVVGIAYDEARAYARWAGKRLPTEMEWVRAARGDDRRPYPWGDGHPEAGLAHAGRGSGDGPAPTQAAEARVQGAGPFGHRDLSGNTWEWCAGRALRGGFWGSAAPLIDTRREEPSGAGSGGTGFRCAR